MSAKKELRKKVLTLLREQEEQKRIEKSRSIQERLFGRGDFQEASHILFYASFDGEVITHDMIKTALRHGKTIGLPVVKSGSYHLSAKIIKDFERDVVDGPFGIKQPRQLPDNNMNRIDMVIVPGIVFDKSNHRIGWGGGYYDRFLCGLPQTTGTLGLAFDFQIVDKIPHIDAHDVSLDGVVSS